MASSSLTNQDELKYDVYMSFRGGDTRDFASHLFKTFMDQGISKIFTDVENLERGMNIVEQIHRSINESRVFLIIFSKNYASSTWCLDELVEILKLREADHRPVFPVFYQLNPEDVENQTGAFADPFEMHIRRGVDKNKVRRWRNALRFACELSGWSWKPTTPKDEATLLQKIVGDIWDAVKPPSKVEIGIIKSSSQIDKILSLLQMSSSDVRIIGLLGESGIGKTTMIRELIRQLSDQFQSFHFFTNVKERMKLSTVNHLRHKLVSGPLGEESLNTQTLSFELFTRQHEVNALRVLVILDDVDDPTHIQELVAERNTLFGPGSRIFITSRNKLVLQNLDVVYEVERMNDHESEQLLRLSALKGSYSLSKFLKQTNGNPLAIRVFGSALREKSDSDWKSALEKLEKFPVSVYNVLKYSYDVLREEEKKVFLDVACFFVGESWNAATSILDDHYSLIHVILRTLIARSLLSVSREYRIEMPYLLQEMAWAIVQEEAERGRRSNLWRPENLYHLLTQREGWMMLGCSSSLCLLSL